MPALRIATRGSQLALKQAEAVRSALMSAHPGCEEPELVVVTTTGDRVRDRPLVEVGGKGVFTREIDRVVLEGGADMAVHSMKDVESRFDPGVAIVAMLPREDPRDAFLSPVAASIGELPDGARVGSSSIRRKAQILGRRPDLDVVTFRGNVDTRLARLASGEVAATVLAAAGLARLGRLDQVTAILPPEVMLPAAGQGAVGVACRAGDDAVRSLLAGIDHHETRLRVTTERAVLARLDGSCRTPVAALAQLDGEKLVLRAQVLSEDGRQVAVARREGSPDDAVEMGDAAGRELLVAAGRDLFGSRTA